MRGGFVPGDVAVNEHYGYRGIFVSGRMGCHPMHSGGHWHNESGLTDSAHDDRRLLVVIDPEDREQVERLHAAYMNARAGSEVAEMQAALRSLTADPKPEEPLGLGAVVECEDGATYVRTHKTVTNPWTRAGFGTLAAYADIPAVKVLSEGVTE